MPTYDVRITAKVTKTIRVDADNESDAIESAHMEFHCLPSEEEVKYNEDTDSCVEVKD